MNCQIPFKEFPKLKSMELQNFRGYAGNFSIDFIIPVISFPFKAGLITQSFPPSATFATFRNIGISLGKLKEKYEEIENKLKSLSGAQSAVKNLIEIIQLYNKVAEEGQALFFTNEADSYFL